MKRVLLDCDGVLADFVTPVIEWAGPGYTRESITEFDILKAWGIEHRQAELDAHCSRPGWCESLPVVPGAQEFVERLRRRFEIVVVTSPYSNVPTWTSERIAWLKRHFDIPKQDVIFSKRKDLVRGDALVDDALHNLERFPRSRLLIDQPWNRIDDGPCLRCRDLDHAADVLDDIGDAMTRMLRADRFDPLEAKTEPVGPLRNLSRAQVAELICDWAAWASSFCRDDTLRKRAAALAQCVPLDDDRKWIYFVQQGTGGPIKIGLSELVASRIAEMQIGNPYALECLVAFPGTQALERALHHVLASTRFRGEWFTPSAALMKLIELALPSRYARSRL